MKNTFLYASLMCLIVTLLCCTKPTQQTAGLTEIRIDPDKVENFIDISPMLEDSIDIIPLETTDECLLLEIDQLTFYRNHFYILDRSRQSISVFDETGRFIRKIGKQGDGPGEYSSIMFFDIVGDSILVSDRQRYNCVIYNLSTGEAIAHFNHKYCNVGGFLLGNNMYFVTNYEKVDRGNFNLCEYDWSAGKIVGKYIPFNDKMEKFRSIGLSNSISKYGDFVYIIYSCNDTIYQVTKEDVSPAYNVRFTTRNRPDDIQVSGMDFYRAVSNGDFVGSLDEIQMSKDYIWMTYLDKMAIRSVCVDRHTHEAKVANVFVVKSLGYLPLSKLYTFNEDLISVELAPGLQASLKTLLSSEHSVVEAKYKGRLRELQKSLKDDSNPVLFRYRLKEVN